MADASRLCAPVVGRIPDNDRAGRVAHAWPLFKVAGKTPVSPNIDDGRRLQGQPGSGKED